MDKDYIPGTYCELRSPQRFCRLGSRMIASKIRRVPYLNDEIWWNLQQCPLTKVTAVFACIAQLRIMSMTDKQDAQLSQIDRAAGCVSFGQKWKTGTGRQYFTDIYRSIFSHCDIIGLQSYRIQWKQRKIRAITSFNVFKVIEVGERWEFCLSVCPSVRLFVCLSVCHTRELWLNGRKISADFIQDAQLSLLTHCHLWMSCCVGQLLGLCLSVWLVITVWLTLLRVTVFKTKLTYWQ